MNTDQVPRYRCNACGNLTRFDVTSRRRTRAFHHFDVSGDLSVEAETVLEEEIEEVSCRWCHSSGSVVGLEAPEKVEAPEKGVDGDPESTTGSVARSAEG